MAKTELDTQVRRTDRAIASDPLQTVIEGRR